MNISVKLTSDHKIQLPEYVIKKMGFSINDEIIVKVEDKKLILTKKEETDIFNVSPKEFWNNNAVEEYLKDEGDYGGNNDY